MGKLDSKIAVVTGAASGIGFAIARRFIEEGSKVYLAGRRMAELKAASDLLGPAATAVPTDVSDWESVEAMFKFVASEQGKIDVVVANAGVVEVSLLKDATQSHFDRIFEINAKGTYFTLKNAIPVMRDGGSIILLSSAMAVKGIPGYGVYNATKAAVRSLARSAAAELRENGIRVNSLSPGPIDTPIIESLVSSPGEAEEYRKKSAAYVPLARLGRPEELAAAALFLASSESSYSTGIDLVVDGGVTQI